MRSWWPGAVVILAVGVFVAVRRTSSPGALMAAPLPWTELSFDVTCGRPTVTRFPWVNHTPVPVALPAVRVRGCSACVSATWAIDRAAIDGDGRLEPGQAAALVLRYDGRPIQDAVAYRLELLACDGSMQEAKIQLDAITPWRELRDALSGRVVAGSAEPVVADLSTVAGWLPRGATLDGERDRVAYYTHTPSDRTRRALVLRPIGRWSTVQAGTIQMAPDPTCAGDVIDWSCVGLPPFECALESTTERRVGSLVIRSRLQSDAAVRVSMSPATADDVGARLVVPARRQAVFAIAADVSPASQVVVTAPDLAFEKRLGVRERR